MQVRLSGAARAYLRKETAYLRQRNPAAADAFVARIATARRNLSSFPNLGVGPERLPIPDARCLVVGDYLVDYDLSPDGVLITSVRHSRTLEGAPPVDEDFDCEADPSDEPKP